MPIQLRKRKYGQSRKEQIELTQYHIDLFIK